MKWEDILSRKNGNEVDHNELKWSTESGGYLKTNPRFLSSADERTIRAKNDEGDSCKLTLDSWKLDIVLMHDEASHHDSLPDSKPRV